MLTINFSKQIVMMIQRWTIHHITICVVYNHSIIIIIIIIIINIKTSSSSSISHRLVTIRTSSLSSSSFDHFSSSIIIIYPTRRIPCLCNSFPFSICILRKISWIRWLLWCLIKTLWNSNSVIPSWSRIFFSTLQTDIHSTDNQQKINRHSEQKIVVQ